MKEKTEFNRKSKLLKLLKTFVVSKMFLIILLLLVQFLFYFALFFNFEHYSSYFGLINLSLSILFFIYISNKPGKNEFKLTWIFPMLIFPIFGIFLYILLKTNYGGLILKKNLRNVKKIISSKYKKPDESALLKKYPEFSDAITYLTNFCLNPAYENTKQKYFESGSLAFTDIKEELKKAQKFIFIEYFIIEPSQIWNEILEILKEKASSGVEIRILYDSLGSLDYSSKRYENFLKKFNIKAKVFMNFIPIINTALNNRDHRKILCIDGKVCYTGGINISDEYANISTERFSYWKDSAIKIEGEAIKSFTTMFLQLWHIANKTLKKSNQENIINDLKNYVEIDYPKFPENGVSIPYCDDAYNDEDTAENVYIYILTHAYKYVHIMTPYTILDNTMINTLCFAAKRGVDVSIIVPKFYDHFITFCVGRVFTKMLIEAGVNVYEYNKGFIHAKSFVSDDKTAAIGSVNLDYRSFYHHFECGLLIHKSNEILKMEQDFQNTLKDCTKLDSSSYKKLSLIKRIVGRCARIISPLL